MNAGERKMASSVTGSQMNNEEDDESNNRINARSPVDDQEEARVSQDDDDATRTLRSEDVVTGIGNNHIDDNVLNEQDRREGDDKSLEQKSKKKDSAKANTKKNGEDKDGEQMTEIQKDFSDKQTEGYSEDNEQIREIKEKLSDKEMDGYSEYNEGFLSNYGEDLEVTKSQDGIDKDCTYEPQQHFKLQKWSDMGDLQEGHSTGTGNIQRDFSTISPIGRPEPGDSVDRFNDVYDGTSSTHHRDLTFDHGSSVDYPEDSPGIPGQTSLSEMGYSDAGNVHNIRNPQLLETILESDSDEAQETQLKGKEDEPDKRKEDKHNKGKEDEHSKVQKDEHHKGKEDEHHKGKEDGHHKGKEDGHHKEKEDEKVILLRKGNIHKLLQHLLEMKVLTEGEYRRCESRPKREEMCAEMMKIVQKKSGGELLLKQALKEVKAQVEDGSPRKIKVSPKLLMEKEREISSLKAKIAMLQKELMTKSDEIKDLKKVKPINVVEPLITDRERNMIHTITERRRASRELEAQPNLSAAINAATTQLQQELEDLKHELMIKDQEMKVVENLKDMYPYITDVLGCPKFPIKLPDHDSTVPMYCPEMKLSLTNANPKACQIMEEVVLINEPSPENTNGYRKYQGTSGSTPFLLPVVVSKMLPHPIQYWETHTVVSLDCMILSFHTLFEIGVCEESIVDKMSWLHKSPRSWSIRIGICRNHHWGVCAQVYGSAAKHGLCFTHVMSNIPEKTSTLCYGIVLDVGTGKIGLIDIGKERVLHTFHVEFRENLYPMFGVQPLADVCSINMALMSGDQVEMTERKERLIIKALSKH